MKKHLRYFIFALLLGALSMILYRHVNSGIKYLSIKELYSVSIQVDSLRDENIQLEEKKKELQRNIALNLLTLEDIQLEYADLIKAEVQTMKAVAGLTKLHGPGVIVMISDGTRELLEDEDPNNVLVHDLDISLVVEDLRNAGAEAISINDERILFGKTDIQCVGPTIRINDRVFSPPYIVRAIGDRKYLESAINSPNNFGERLRSWGVIVEVNTSLMIEVPAYQVKEEVKK